LSKIEVETNKVEDKKVFYTALYHTMQQPRLMNDVSGTYPKFSQQYQIGFLNKGRDYYDDFLCGIFSELSCHYMRLFNQSL